MNGASAITCNPTLKVTFAGAGPPATAGVNVARNVSMSLYCGVRTDRDSAAVPAALFTVNVSDSELLGANGRSGTNSAVIECVTAPRLAIERDAMPFDGADAPSGTLPSEDATAPPAGR